MKTRFEKNILLEIENNEKINPQIYSESKKISKQVALDNGLSEEEIEILYKT